MKQATHRTKTTKHTICNREFNGKEKGTRRQAVKATVVPRQMSLEVHRTIASRGSTTTLRVSITPAGE
jgi:hypothetical protein